MTTVQVNCTFCGKKVNKPLGEYNRRIKKGFTKFYCNNSCAQSDQAKPVVYKDRVCPICQTKFSTPPVRRKYATFCSRSCASKGSVTDLRRKAARESALKNVQKGNLISTSQVLKLREAWRYSDILAYLQERGLDSEYEFRLGKYVFDLFIPARKLLFEFDGNYHKGSKQRSKDKSKDLLAITYGFSVVRIPTTERGVFARELVVSYIP